MSKGKSRLGAPSVVDLNLAVDNDRPRVELLIIIHDDGASLLDDSEYHDGAKSPPHTHSEMLEGLQSLGKL